MWLDLGDLRIVHACWDREAIARISNNYNHAGGLSNSLLYSSCTHGNWEFKAVETLLKGKEIALPSGHSFFDKEGTERHHIRVRWWDGEARNYRAAYLGSEKLATQIPDDDITGDHLLEYSRQD